MLATFRKHLAKSDPFEILHVLFEQPSNDAIFSVQLCARTSESTAAKLERTFDIIELRELRSSPFVADRALPPALNEQLINNGERSSTLALDCTLQAFNGTSEVRLQALVDEPGRVRCIQSFRVTHRVDSPKLKFTCHLIDCSRPHLTRSEAIAAEVLLEPQLIEPYHNARGKPRSAKQREFSITKRDGGVHFDLSAHAIGTVMCVTVQMVFEFDASAANVDDLRLESALVSSTVELTNSLRVAMISQLGGDDSASTTSTTSGTPPRPTAATVGVIMGTPGNEFPSFLHLLGSLSDQPTLSRHSRVSFVDVRPRLLKTDASQSRASLSFIECGNYLFDVAPLPNDVPDRMRVKRDFDRNLLRLFCQGLPDDTIFGRTLTTKNLLLDSTNALSHVLIFANAQRLVRYVHSAAGAAPAAASPSHSSTPHFSHFVSMLRSWFATPKAPAATLEPIPTTASGGASPWAARQQQSPRQQNVNIVVDTARLTMLLALYREVVTMLSQTAYKGNSLRGAARVALVVTDLDLVSTNDDERQAFTRTVIDFLTASDPDGLLRQNVHFTWRDCAWDPSALHEHDQTIASTIAKLNPDSTDYLQRLEQLGDIFHLPEAQCLNPEHQSNNVHTFSAETVNVAEAILTKFVAQMSARASSGNSGNNTTTVSSRTSKMASLTTTS
jgi:hypothetical protein